jgi:hypothetical protein
MLVQTLSAASGHRKVSVCIQASSAMMFVVRLNDSNPGFNNQVSLSTCVRDRTITSDMDLSKLRAIVIRTRPCAFESHYPELYHRLCDRAG